MSSGKCSSPYKEIGLHPQQILGSVGEQAAKQREKRRQWKTQWRAKKAQTIDEMFGPVDPETGKRQSFAAIGEKTGGHW